MKKLFEEKLKKTWGKIKKALSKNERLSLGINSHRDVD